MNALLTDDEIVALAQITSVPWAFPMLTVADDERAITAAAFRGLRSLFARDLGTAEDPASSTISPEILALYMSAASSPRVAIAHVSVGDRPRIAGSCAIAFLHDAGVTLDKVSATGVHAIEVVEAAAARDALLSLTRGWFDASADSALPAEASVLVTVSDGDRVARVTPGRVEIGHVDGSGSEARFVSDLSGPDFDPVVVLVGHAS